MSIRASRPPGERPNAALPVIAALVLVAIMGLSYREWQQYSRVNSEAIEARALVDSIDRLVVSLTDAESGERGFLLTGDDAYLGTYNQAIQKVPDELSAASRLLSIRPGQSASGARLKTLTADKLTELRENIQRRRESGQAPPLSIILGGRGKESEDDIRLIADQIRRTEVSSQAKASAEGQAASGTALLATIAGTVVLLFLFAFGLEPFASPEPQALQRSRLIRYGAAVGAVVGIALLRGALTPLIGRTNLPFTMFFYAVAFAAWFGGFRPAVLSIVLSLAIASWFFAAPTGSFFVSGRDDQVAMLMIVVVGFGVALLSRSQRNAVELASFERDRLLKANTELARANEDLNQFAFAASHDLQEPLRMVSAYSQLLVRNYQGNLTGDAEACVKFIKDGTSRMKDLLTDLLNYAHLGGTGQAAETLMAIDLNQVFVKVLENCMAGIEEAGASVTSDELPTVYGHEPHLIQLFQNLITNAIKYRSSLPLRIHVSAEEKNGFWQIAVADNGIGIAPEYRQQIFGVFKRLHGSAIPGTGMGLAICQRVVQRYGGRIWVESEVNRGATFYFTFPAGGRQ